MTQEDLSNIMEKVLLEFPMYAVNVNLPKWMQALPIDSKIITELVENIKENSKNIVKMKDFHMLNDIFNESENFEPLEINEIKLGEGCSEYNVVPKDDLFYKTLSCQCGEEIKDDYDLMGYIKGFAESKNKYAKIKEALFLAEQDGYGVVIPSIDEMQLEQPVLVKQNGRYGVKLKAKAPSLHIMKVDVTTEISPTVGNERQGEDMVNFLTNKFQENPDGIWETNMFGRSLQDLVKDGMSDKLSSLPKDAQQKLGKTLTKMVNENRGGMICILL